jgi:hypothetical protein
MFTPSLKTGTTTEYRGALFNALSVKDRLGAKEGEAPAEPHFSSELRLGWSLALPRAILLLIGRCGVRIYLRVELSADAFGVPASLESGLLLVESTIN